MSKVYLEENNQLVIDNVAIPRTKNIDRWATQDADEAWHYYPNYARFAVTPMHPSQYYLEIFYGLPVDIRHESQDNYPKWNNNWLQELQEYVEIYKIYAQSQSTKRGK